jgi:hypothetical protein
MRGFADGHRFTVQRRASISMLDLVRGHQIVDTGNK